MMDYKEVISSLDDREKKRVHKRAMFLQLLHDPDVADLATQFVQAATKAAQNGHIPANTQQPLVLKRSKGKRRLIGVRTGLEEAIASLGDGAPEGFATRFTWQDVARTCRERGVDATDKAIRDAVYRQSRSKTGRIRLVSKGSGMKPSLYEFLPKSKEE